MAVLLKKKRAVTLIDYSLLAVLVAFAVLSSVQVFGTGLRSEFCKAQNAIAFVNNSDLGCWNYIWGYGVGATYSIHVAPSISCFDYDSYCSAGSTSVDSQLLYSMNKLFPIQSVYALRGDGGQDLNTYEKAFGGLGLGVQSDHGLYNSKVQQAFQYEVLSQNGDVIGVFNDPKSLGLGFRNLRTNATYVYDHGNARYVGISDESGNL